MCTVSVIPFRGGFRLVHNRDELRRRVTARPPIIVETDGVRALMPIDPESGGTWVAGTENGLAFALLNLNERESQPAAAAGRSRGGIIPPLLGCRTVAEAAAAMLSLQRGIYRPFRLIVAGGGVVSELRHAAARPARQRLTSPMMFTSSGLGDHLVEAPRRALFERIMAGRGDHVQKQDRFHAHRWRARPHISVDMERAEASTVSRTVLEVEGDRVHMEYTAVGRSESARQSSSVQLRRQRNIGSGSPGAS
jgi:Transport and Golgi organisation 2